MTPNSKIYGSICRAHLDEDPGRKHLKLKKDPNDGLGRGRTLQSELFSILFAFHNSLTKEPNSGCIIGLHIALKIILIFISYSCTKCLVCPDQNERIKQLNQIGGDKVSSMI
jgi:hypothetical protein